METFEVGRAVYEDRIIPHVEKINRKNERNGFPQVNVSVVGSEYRALVQLPDGTDISLDDYPKWVTRANENPRNNYPADPFNPQADEVVLAARNVEFVRFLIEGAAPSFDGWLFVGTVEGMDSDEEGLLNDVRSVPGYEINARYRHSDPYVCEHCGYSRVRNHTFIVQNIESGEQVQVGSSCVKDFTGRRSPQAIASYFDGLEEFISEIPNYGYGSIWQEREWKLEGFMSVVSAVVREYGWISGSEARDNWDLNSTASTACEYLTPPGPYANETWQEKQDRILPNGVSGKDRERAVEIIEWARGEFRRDGNEYEYKMYAAVRNEYVLARNTGLAASAIAGYLRMKDREEELARKEEIGYTNEFVGEIGDRLKGLILTVERIYEKDGHYGITWIMNFRDNEGNRFTWFNTSRKGFEFYSEDNIERTFEIDGTVKDHNEWNGINSTVITRGRVKREVE